MKDKKENKVKTAFVVTAAILALISMLPVMASAQTTGDININEIMYNPSTEQGRDTNMEWLELYNNDTMPINISGWTIDNNPILGKIMQPGGYVVLARNKTAFEAYYGALPCSVIEATFGLTNNPGDTIVLKNSTGIEIDNVTYINNWGANGNNKTLELNATGGWEESRIDGGTPCRRNSVLGIPPQVTNASANPPVIAVNTDITELRVDAAGIESPIDVVTVDLSPIGGNASTVMFNIGNYTQDNISWTMYNYTTNASVEGTFNLTVNATDINGNYNDTGSIMLDVKKTVIHFPTFPAMTYISNISVDANVPGNVGKNATTEQFTSTEVIDNKTYYVVNTTKPVGSTKMYVGVDVVNEDLTMKRRVREREPGVEVANLTFDPAFVSRDFPLWVGKNWMTTTNVTGMLVNRTGAVILIDTNAVVSGEVTDEVNITVPYGTIHCLVVEVKVNLQNPSESFLTRYWMGYDETNEMLIIPKSQRYSNENLMEELELINAQSSIVWHTYQEGMQIAGSQDKPTMIFFESSNCPACKKQKEVLADAHVINMSKNFVPIAGSGRLGGQYGIRYIPTIVFTNSQGEEVYRIVGYRDADTLVEEMRQALKSSNLIVMPPMFLTAADNGSEVELKKGQSLVITLEANPTTGYTWEVAEPLDEQVIRQVGEIEFVPESDLIGAGGVQIIRFEAVGAGQTTIKLVYHRPWETEVEPLGTFSVQVVIR